MMVPAQHTAGRRLWAASALVVVVALAALAAVPGASAEPLEPLEPAAYLNAEGLPLLMPTMRRTNNHTWYYEIPRQPAGVLVILHRCGRNAEDTWPPSSVCPQCIGMPEAVSIAKQGLARGYALLAINSFNRSVGSMTRCWSWHTDARPVQAIVESFVQEFNLTGLPLFFTGCSSGGSLAMRLPPSVKIDGIIPIAIGLEMSAFPGVELKAAYPPTAFIHFPKDNNTATKVGNMMDVMREDGVPAEEVQVPEFPVTPDFFSNRDPMISTALSERLHSALASIDAIDSQDYEMAELWGHPDRSMNLGWDRLMDQQLAGWIKASETEQLALKGNTTLAKAQEALGAAGEQLLTIQEVTAEENAAADEEAAEEDVNPNFSDSDGVTSSSGGQDPYLSDILLRQHIWEELTVAWAAHTNIGDYTTAALIWLENCGRVDFSELLSNFTVQVPAKLSPVRTATYEEVALTWQQCSAEAAAAAAAASNAPPAVARSASSSSQQAGLMSTSGAQRRPGASIWLSALLAAAASAVLFATGMV